MLNKEFVNCSLCHSNNYMTLYTKKFNRTKYQIVCCKICGLKFINPRQIKAEENELYNEKYYNFHEIEDRANIIKAINHVNILKSHKSKGRLLDVGCGKGFFLKIAHENDWETYGIDISKYSCRFARDKFNLNVSVSDIENIKSPEKYFDVITLWDVLEHLRNPREELRKLNKLLKNGGMLFIETPNIDSIFYRLYRRYWLGFNAFHLYYFSPRTLEEILQQSGFKLMRFETVLVNLFSKEGLWNRGLKTPVAEILGFLGLKEKIKKWFLKRKFTEANQIDYKHFDYRDFIPRQNKLVSLINHPFNYLINKLKMGDHLLVITKK